MTIRFDFGTFPQLETDNLLLREITLEDTTALFALFSDPEVTQHIDVTTFRHPRDAEMLANFVEDRYQRREGIRWAITLKDDPAATLIGTCGYNVWSRHNNCAEIGYDLRRDLWSQGIMTGAIKAIARFGFAEMGLNRIEADVMPGNPGSARVLEKVGFVEEGTLRQRGYWKGQYHDLRLFSLLHEEFVQGE